jgi:hypothetical protein
LLDKVDDDVNAVQSEVETILDHDGAPSERVFLVKWKNFSHAYNFWLQDADLRSTRCECCDTWFQCGFSVKNDQSLCFLSSSWMKNWGSC